MREINLFCNLSIRHGRLEEWKDENTIARKESKVKFRIPNSEGGKIMLSVRGIFNGKTVELLEDVPYQKKVPVIVIFGEYEPSPEQAKERALMREHYLRQRITEGATNEELRQLISDMDRIDRDFETNPNGRRGEAKRYADQKLREWCEKHGVAYNPTDDLAISDFINDAIKQVREENKRKKGEQMNQEDNKRPSMVTLSNITNHKFYLQKER